MDRSEVMIPSVSMAISFGYEYLRIKQSSNGSLDMEACPDVSFKSCDSFIIYGDTLHCSRVFTDCTYLFFVFFAF
ncbi:hypothetical protein NC652_031144 [Populus alba x Populus x berolinensis]|nr:hypothetical protein NC652_031144 [Populus alba x Populus x berolinensis]